MDDLELAPVRVRHHPVLGALVNVTRLHSSIGNVPPIEYEAEYHRHINPSSNRSRENPPSTKPPGRLNLKINEQSLERPGLASPISAGLPPRSIVYHLRLA